VIGVGCRGLNETENSLEFYCWATSSTDKIYLINSSIITNSSNRKEVLTIKSSISHLATSSSLKLKTCRTSSLTSYLACISRTSNIYSLVTFKTSSREQFSSFAISEKNTKNVDFIEIEGQGQEGLKMPCFDVSLEVEGDASIKVLQIQVRPATVEVLENGAFRLQDVVVEVWGNREVAQKMVDLGGAEFERGWNFGWVKVLLLVGFSIISVVVGLFVVFYMLRRSRREKVEVEDDSDSIMVSLKGI